MPFPPPPPAANAAPGAGIPPPPQPPRARRSSSPQEKPPWAPPPPPGPTLRQVVERNEREMGLRCSDVSCGIGPSDDDDCSASPALAPACQIAIRKAGAAGVACEHRFHPACLVAAERVAGWAVGEHDAGEAVEAACPVCRSAGVIPRAEWQEGVSQLV
ncbi:uncharacterized protein BXZ73DRAFT_50550 [Epithele typhae]|uniref:uncharacterized protein n=1 Tax=Epithele typhae TaxID=378194 RepID=UPI002008D461|nr:uncharacterized protein BXZ73DRAFT_50550 [Epithele typhae]KAH9924342.1 hypothetical protein BXZ73DRAFT_50550 [Epithele typhae]